MLKQFRVSPINNLEERTNRKSEDDLIHRIFIKCDTIIGSKKIEDEYEGKAKDGGMAPFIIQNKLEALKQLKKYKRINRSRIDARMRQRKIPQMPSDRFDKKFFILGVAEEIKYLITLDGPLLGMTPFRYFVQTRQLEFEVIQPSDYQIEEN